MVIVGDLNHNFSVHAPVQGRGPGDSASGPPVTHFSGPAGLASISEGSASSSTSAVPDDQMVGFIKVLLTRSKNAAASFALLSGEWWAS